MTVYNVKVTGIAWAGYKASTEYTFDHNPTKPEIIARAGDFQSLSSARVVARTVSVQEIERYRF